MGFIIQKIITSFLVLPGLLVTILLILGLTVRRKERRSSTMFLTLALLSYLMTTGLGARVFVSPWEQSFSPIPLATGEERAIVILGGGSLFDAGTSTMTPGPYTLLRCQAAFSLYQDHPLPVIVSGGNIWPTELSSDAALMKDTLVQWGIPERDIILEDQSLTTWENARYCAPILGILQADHFFLVTSGTHLKRSLYAFSHHMPTATITPVRAHLAYDLIPVSLADFLPSLSAFNAISQVLHEAIGYLFYRLPG